MPLYVARRPGHDGWWITGTVTPAGAKQGVRIRRRAGSDTERLAREEAASLEANTLRDFHLGKRPDARTWAQAVTAYMGHEARSRGTAALMGRLLRHFAETPLDRINQEAVNHARDVILRPGAKPGTVTRNIVVPIRAVMTFAADMGWCPPPRIKAPSVTEGRTPRVLPGEFEAVRDAIAPQHRALLTWYACTGCRRGETQALDWSDVDLQAATARLWADTTKAGRVRIVRLPPAAVAALAGLERRSSDARACSSMLEHRAGRVFGDVDIRSAWRTACRRAGLRLRGVHDLRHAYASWHYALHRDLIALRDAGGWATVGQVERYAHLLAEGQEAAIRRVWGLTTMERRMTA